MKRVYNKIILIITHMLLKIEIFKTWSAEWIAILRKRALYKDVKWTKEKQKQFDDFGRKITVREYQTVGINFIKRLTEFFILITYLK